MLFQERLRLYSEVTRQAILMNHHRAAQQSSSNDRRENMVTAFKMLNFIYFLILIIETIKSEPICEERPYVNSTAKRKELFCRLIPLMSTLRNVISLQVYGDINEIKDQFKTPSLQLEKLNLSHCNIKEIKPNAFAAMNKLTIMDLSHNKIELLTEDIFRNLSSLEILSLEGNGIKVILEGSLADLKGLLGLNLADNKLLEIPNDLPPLIRDLNLHNNVIERISLDIINSLVHLEILNLCGNEITTWPIGNYISRVRQFCIGERVISSDGKFWNITVMNDLHISSSYLNHTDLNENIKDTISSLYNLQNLYIENYKIDSFKFVHSIIHLKSLTLDNIRLKGNEIADFPKNLRKIVINKSPELARKILDQGPFQQLEYLDLKNNALEKISSTQNEKLLMSVNYLDISFNPLNCTEENWFWMLEKLKMKKNFLVNNNVTTCSEPSTAKGSTLFEILYDIVRSSNTSHVDKPHNTTEVTRVHFDEKSIFNETDVWKGILIFFIFIVFFLSLSALLNNLVIKFPRDNTQDNNQQESSNPPLQETNNTIHISNDLEEQVNNSFPQVSANPENRYFQNDGSTKCKESFTMRNI